MGLLLVALASPAEAQSGKLSGPEIRTAIAGKAMSRIYTMRPVSRDRPNELVPVRFPSTVRFYFRDDGSYTRQCKSQTPRGEQNCPEVGERSAGVWQIKGDQLCFGSLVMGSGSDPDAACYFIYRPETRSLQLERAGGRPGLMNGTWTLER
jgi:hypothetical protein